MHYHLRTESLCGLNREPVLTKAHSEGSSSSHSWIFKGQGYQPGAAWLRVQPTLLSSGWEARLLSVGLLSLPWVSLQKCYFWSRFPTSSQREQFHKILLWLLDLGMFSQFHTWRATPTSRAIPWASVKYCYPCHYPHCGPIGTIFISPQSDKETNEGLLSGIACGWSS